MVSAPGPLTHERIKHIHRELLRGIDDREGYRTNDVRVLRATFDATPAPYVRADMDVLLAWLAKNIDILHPLVLAGAFHHQFERLHPFFDGNGRTGRVIINFLLMRAGYPPLLVPRKHRAAYLDALHRADAARLGKPSPETHGEFISFLAAELVENYWNVFL
ncbi:MAG: Fic family protein [Deltaproteobacteria bacterium]|nr:Fic family protein [Deltaproteobacteria bacterium]